jgi:hypothetical protein
MAADMTGEQMQAKITAARREAEGLKDKIRRRKDELADTSRTIFPPLGSPLLSSIPSIFFLLIDHFSGEAEWANKLRWIGMSC